MKRLAIWRKDDETSGSLYDVSSKFVTEIGYNGTRYVMIVDSSGTIIEQMWCLDVFDYETV